MVEDECEPASNDQAFWYPDNDQSGLTGPEKVDLERLPPQQQLLAAAAAGNTDIAREALRRGAQINSCTNGDAGDTALINAARMGQTAMVSFLLSQGADADARNARDRCAADEAGTKDHIIKLLERQTTGSPLRSIHPDNDYIEEELEAPSSQKQALSSQMAAAAASNQQLDRDMGDLKDRISPLLDGPTVLQKATIKMPVTKPPPPEKPTSKPVPPEKPTPKKNDDVLKTGLEARAARLARQEAAAAEKEAAAKALAAAGNKAGVRVLRRGRPGHDFDPADAAKPEAMRGSRKSKEHLSGRHSLLQKQPGVMRGNRQVAPPNRKPRGRFKQEEAAKKSSPPIDAVGALSTDRPTVLPKTPQSWMPPPTPEGSPLPRQSHPLPRGLRRAADRKSVV